ncbi:MAG TPA: glycosyltransferase family 39 protein [Thermoanaerobaculia bacterium]|nr:glycosyltransferase family 39 protein [Thermoanaerobaculia bacterium]
MVSGTAATPSPEGVRRDLLLLALATALLFLPGLGRRDLWNPDEARYAEVAREMRQARSWALPRLDGAIYTQKPPLFFWLIDAAVLLTGEVDETAARLPSALAGIAACLLVYRLGHRFWGRRAGWLAALVFATSFKVFWQARFGQIDMLLTFLVALQLWWFARGYTEGRPRLYWLMYLAGGLAVLAKGPAGLLPPLLAIVAFLLWNGERGELRRLRFGRGLLLVLAVVLCWLVPAGIAGGRAYLDQIVLRQNVTRYANPWHHFAPWYYYLTVIPPELLPWSFLLPTALVAGRGLGGRPRQGFRLALCWALVTLVFFSVSPAKRDVYVLTLYPALALLVGSALDRLATLWPAWRRWATVPFALLAGFVLLLVVALPIAGRGRVEAVPLGGDRFVWLLTTSLCALLLGAAAAWWVAHHGRLARAAGFLALGMAAFELVLAFVLLPRMDAYKSARELSAELVARLQPGDVYGIYPRLDNTFVFYSGRFAEDLDGEARLRAFVARPGRVWVLAPRQEWANLWPPLPLVEVAHDDDPRDGYLLLARPEMAARASTPRLPPAR